LSLLVNNPGYNEKQIQFPTTIVDLGPRDEFVSEICSSPNFKGYISNQFRSTSYKDVSDLIQMGFISRLLNQTIIQQMLPISVGGNNSEGKGVIQFFNSDRGGDRIDGDFAQALSINSEFKVTPYLSDNYPNNFLFIGDDGQGSKPKPVFGVFYSSTTEEYVVRRRYTPGYETYSLSPLIVDPFGYPSTQEVPFYRWKISKSTNIFGSENNNWDTDVVGTGFYKQKYQSLDYNTDPYFKTSTSNPAFGFITNFDNSGNPDPSNSGVIYGLPSTPIIVGSPGHFYFGLNVGETALNRFIKLYIDTKED
jgi:hypothetical protein